MNETEKVLAKALRVLQGLPGYEEGRYDVPGDDSHDQIDVDALIPEIKNILKKGKHRG